MQTLYLSIDIEANGECPGLHSMLSIGMAGYLRDKTLMFQYEANLFPLQDAGTTPSTMKFWEENKEAYNYVSTNQRDAQEVMMELSKKIKELRKTYKIVVIGWPINYDWQWIHYYFHRFTKSNPLGFSARCISSYAWAVMKNEFPVNKQHILEFIDPTTSHTHKALDDAKEQGMIFLNLMNHNLSKRQESLWTKFTKLFRS